MTRLSIRHLTIALGIACCSVAVQAQMSPDIADKIKDLGRVINQPATAALYAPRLLETAQYATLQVHDDHTYAKTEPPLLARFPPRQNTA